MDDEVGLRRIRPLKYQDAMDALGTLATLLVKQTR
jgi:hypothetical protein